MATAQEIFNAAVRDSFAPALRAAGLRGSGSTFHLPSESHFALLGFQKSQFNDSDAVKFTVNLKVVSKDMWAEVRRSRPHFPKKPAANTGYGTFEWHSRIGQLLDGGEDRWWYLQAGENNAPVITEVIEAVCETAVPELRRRVEQSA